MSVIESRLARVETDLTPVGEPTAAKAELYAHARAVATEASCSLPSDEPDRVVVRAWMTFSRTLAEFAETWGERWPGSAGASDRMTMTLDVPHSEPRLAEAVAGSDRHRYAELSQLLDAWAADPSDFDAAVDPLIEQALRETAPRHFPDR